MLRLKRQKAAVCAAALPFRLGSNSKLIDGAYAERDVFAVDAPILRVCAAYAVLDTVCKRVGGDISAEALEYRVYAVASVV